ncbi:MAG: HK97 family phage prohead protease [Paracoccus sp. (in: a-proteobacteria)]
MTMHMRSLAPHVSTVDHGARTVEAIASTFADVQRAGFTERLARDGVDPTRLIGAPVLDGHRNGSTRDQLGVIDAAEIRPEGLWVRMKMRSTDAARAILTDIAEGTLRGLSIGYRVAEWKDEREGVRRVRTAVKWEAIEVSIVPIPADAGAHFRTGDNDMPDTTPDAQTRATINSEIRSIAATAGLDQDWIDTQIDAGATADVAREAAFTAMQERGAQTATRSQRAQITFDHNDPQVIAARAGEAIYARAHPEHQLRGPSRAFAHMTFQDHAREVLRRAGMNCSGLSTDTIVTRALHSTSDFPLILGDAVNRELRASYNAAPSGARQVARQSTARDFRPKRKLTLGNAPELERVGEGGEYPSGTIDEAQETYRIGTFGKIIGFSRQMIVNDDLGAFSDMPRKMGIAARAFENDFIVNMILSNPAMSDSHAVFSATHGNVTADFAFNVSTLSAARTVMRRQKGLGGMLIDVTPRYLLVPPELETAGERMIADITATTTDDVNSFSKLSLLVEPRLTDPEQYYIVADPATVDGLEYPLPEGAPGLQTETRAGFEADGVQTKVRLDFGAGWIDHRGWHRVG